MSRLHHLLNRFRRKAEGGSGKVQGAFQRREERRFLDRMPGWNWLIFTANQTTNTNREIFPRKARRGCADRAASGSGGCPRIARPFSLKAALPGYRFESHYVPRRCRITGQEKKWKPLSRITWTCWPRSFAAKISTKPNTTAISKYSLRTGARGQLRGSTKTSAP